MPIDKLIPRFLVSDEDERLLKEGAMTDALNVTISEDGDGSEGVVKNVKGTDAASPESDLTLGSELTVIGQVSDPQRGFIYFFVTGDSNTEHAIYQYNTKSIANEGLASNTYREVFSNAWLDFQADGFVKADVLNGAFQQDGVIQTILYFTDNYNQPRKINVDRAIAGDYNGLVSSELDYALNVVKAAPDTPISFSFVTDSTLSLNNFRGVTFQLAAQYIYTDGEESAISSYSRLAFPDSNSIIGMDSSSSNFSSSNFYDDNVCELIIPWNESIADVEKIRLLFREGNAGAFRVIDEFDPDANLSRSVLGTTRNVYDYQTKVYEFYNDGAYPSVDASTINKLYDNVPLKAQGQAITGNRLIYSDYTEGRANGDDNGSPVVASITVEYSPERSGGANSSGVAGITENADEEAKVDIDFGTLFTGSATTVPAGSTTTVSFDWDAEGFIGRETDGVVVFQAIGNQAPYIGGSFQIKFGSGLSSGSTTDKIPVHQVTGSWQVKVTIYNPNELTYSEFASFFADYVSDFTWVKTYDVNFADMRGTIFNSSGMQGSYIDGSPWSLTSGSYSVTTAWKFDADDITVASDTVTMVPKVTSVFIGGVTGIQDAGNINILTSSQNDVGYYDMYDNNSTPSYPFITNASFVSSANHSLSTFKAGSTHDIGIVYYDKYNRSGNVNKIGSVYVSTFGDASRVDGSDTFNGPASLKVTFPSIANGGTQPPSWAERYQFVYPGMGSFDSVVSYTAGGAYYNRQDDQDRRVYVSINTLTDFGNEKSALLDYSFTEGDKLRVIQRDDGSGSYTTNPLDIVYPRANDGSVIEFDVVGVLNIPEGTANADNILHDGGNAYGNDDPHIGTFLILESPAIHSALEVTVTSGQTSSTSQLKYEGFDWYSISDATTYPNADNVQANYNLWNQRCLFEILTPAKTERQVYYEIGESYPVRVSRLPGANDNKHGAVRYLSAGDIHYKPTSCKTPWRDPNNSDNWNSDNPDDWRYETIYTESQSVNDFFSSKSWNKGRAHVVLESSASIRRVNGLTYSDAYAEDVANLSLSSFNPSLGNFDSLDGRYGAVEYIGNYNDDLVALQENKLCLIPVNKNILEYASGSADVAVSTNVLGQRRYSAGDYGSGGHPEAVIIQDNSVYFVDESRQAVCGLIGGQLVPISEKGMSSFFEDFFTNSHIKYVSGYDPRDNTYYVTGLGGTAETVGYDAARGVWQSKYSFTPDVYANQNNMLYSAKHISGNDIFWKHDNTSYNTFYGTAHPSSVQVVSKLSPSRVKVFNAISYEGDSDAWETPSATPIQTSLAMFAGQITSWSEREGSYYASIPKDAINPELLYLGTISSAANNDLLYSTLTMSDMVRFDRLPIDLITTTDPVHSIPLSVGTQLITSFSQSDKQITLFGTFTDPNSLVGTKLYAKILNSHALRGHWAKITLTNSSTTKHELYCINTHITDSKLHHPLGQ